MLTITGLLLFLPTAVIQVQGDPASLVDVPGEGTSEGTGEVPILAPMAPIQFGDDEDNAWATPFFEGATYDPAVADPEELFGQPIGSRLASHEEILAMLRAIAATSDRVTIEPYGRTFEGRELVTLTITSPENHGRLPDIAAGARALFDPRGKSDSELGSLRAEQPGIAWMGYGIHGDETSASEAAVPFVYHLAASTDESVTRALSQVVVVLDPCLNPDGRERIRSMVVQGAGYRANLDDGAMQRGRWPGGRGNHYLFDMNRDWMAGEAPETRGRWARLLEMPPQLFVDAHEMSGLDTFLFYPQAAPRNAYLPKRLDHWQNLLANDAARVFDEFGWGYYTREWADALYPGYSDAWGSLTGAIGMLYEQGRTIGAPLERESGEIVAYRESVHGQIAASLSNLMSFARMKDEIMGDYLAHRQWASDAESPLGKRAFAVVRSADGVRDAHFLRSLTGQGIEVFETEGPMEVTGAVDGLGKHFDTMTLPDGTWIVPAAQPQGAMVRAYLDFDQRLDEPFLRKERESIERGQGSKIYDVTGWDLGRQAGVRGYWIDAPDMGAAKSAMAAATEERATHGLEGAYAWVVNGDDQRALRFAARAMELGVKLHVADREFRVSVRGAGAETTTWNLPRGSFLARRHENPDEVDELILRAARDSGADVRATLSGRSHDEGPDLGGGHFELLEAPKVALFSNTPVSSAGFGHVWSYLDQELGMPVTLVDAQAYRNVDLARYNVLIAPGGLGKILKAQKDRLGDWVRAGGTLVAIGSSASALASPEVGLSKNRLRRDVLDEMDSYGWRTAKERGAFDVTVDLNELYGDQEPQAQAAAEEPGDEPGKTPGDEPAGDDDAAEVPDTEEKALDEWRRGFAPAGVILRAELDPSAWITAGVVPALLGTQEVPVSAAEGAEVHPAELPVPFAGASILMPAVRPAVRLAKEDRLRLAGLLWPEARVRTADSAWLTVERLGRGQVISFVSSPVFRGSWRGTARLLGNAVLVGPGVTD